VNETDKVEQILK